MFIMPYNSHVPSPEHRALTSTPIEMSTSSTSSSALTTFGHKASSSVATTFSSDLTRSDLTRTDMTRNITTPNYAVVRSQISSLLASLLILPQAFNIPHQLYHLGVESSKELEEKARRHFNIHVNWTYTKAHRDALHHALVEIGKDLENLEEDLSAAAKGLDDAIGAGYTRLKELPRPIVA